ncbi:MAG: class I SAM-dependent methyltransferase [Phycisphaerales bacterium]|nr:class I SAM-dependent methyltransferase [Phycisphaerales bacterium]
MNLQNNKDVYSTVEFNQWAHRAALLPAEQFVIEKYVDRAGPALEAGTGGGRIVLGMRDLGYQRLGGFDFVPDFIKEARTKDPEGRIDFRVADATRLEYADASYRQVLYLQQILSLIESDEMRQAALRESFRVLAPGGLALFSLLSYEARRHQFPYNMFLAWNRAVRGLHGDRRGPQYWPWLKLGGKFNWPALLDRGPYVYWFRVGELDQFFGAAGYRIEAVASVRQIESGRMMNSCAELEGQPLAGTLFVVCRKPT